MLGSRLPPRASGGVAPARRQLVPAGAATRRVPLSFPVRARARARVRRGPLARRSLGEPVPPPPRADDRGGTLPRAGRRADDAPNRYALAEALTAEQARIKRGGRTAALCFLDLDRFKTVNDTYGYAAGDKLLVDVHQRLRSELRASDLVFRWGGEEFVVLAPHVEPQSWPTSPSVSACSSRPGRSRSTGGRARSPAASAQCYSTRRVSPRTPSRRRAGWSRRPSRRATQPWSRSPRLRLPELRPGPIAGTMADG